MDYWADGGKTPKGRTADLVATLESALAANPDHIGAIHLYIHAVEASDRPERAEPYADRLAAQNVSAGHLAHMPSHIYYRLGRYEDSLEINKAAVAADEEYLAKAQPEGIYSGTYYPHNIHFVLVSAQMAGDAATALDAAEKLGRSIPAEIARVGPWSRRQVRPALPMRSSASRRRCWRCPPGRVSPLRRFATPSHCSRGVRPTKPPGRSGGDPRSAAAPICPA